MDVIAIDMVFVYQNGLAQLAGGSGHLVGRMRLLSQWEVQMGRGMLRNGAIFSNLETWDGVSQSVTV
jgi:hypothetical protein